MTDEELDRIAAASVTETAPTRAERDAAWEDILRRLEPAKRPAFAMRKWIAVPAVAAAMAITAAVALLPSGPSDGSAPGLLATASAAEVLRAAADGVTLGAPGPGEQLYVRERLVRPLGDGRSDVSITRSWSAADGSGRIERATEGPGGGEARSSRKTFGAGAPATGDPFEDWRGAFTAAELETLATDRDALLAQLRGKVDALGEDLDVLGRDLGVIGITVTLLDRAPVEVQQRAALFDLLASAPEWSLPGSSVTPLSVERLRSDREGDVRIRIESRLTESEREQIASDNRGWALDLTVDPAQGRLTELREYENGLGARPELTTVEEQRIVSVD